MKPSGRSLLGVSEYWDYAAPEGRLYFVSNKTWKAAERRVAARFGAKRTGPTGRDDNDFIHPLIAPEIKYRKTLPAWALQCLEQARAGRSAGGKTPVTILLGRGMRVTDALVVMTMRDFEDLWGPLQTGRWQTAVSSFYPKDAGGGNE